MHAHESLYPDLNFVELNGVTALKLCFIFLGVTPILFSGAYTHLGVLREWYIYFSLE